MSSSFDEAKHELIERYQVLPELIKDMNGTLCVNIDGFWFGTVLKDSDHKIVESVAIRAKNYSQFKHFESKHPELIGKCIIILSSGEIFMTDVDGDALQMRIDKNDTNAYVGVLGASMST